jgi:hypothetical protein
MISIKGGIRFGQGFQRLSKGRNDVSPLGVAVHQDLIKTYHDGEQDMKVHYEFQY